MTAVFAVAGAMLTVAAALTIVRLVRGPATLDRLVATDMLLAITLCGIATHAATTRDSSAVIVVVVVALLGFISATGVARLLGRNTRRWEQRQ